MSASPAPIANDAPTVDQRIAAIDIGSNSIRQIVADVSPTGRIRVVDEMKAMPRLGSGLERTGALLGSAIESGVAAVQRMVALARTLNAERIEIVATSAVRDASNALDFTSRILRETGLPVRVLSGEEEALLCHRSALAHFELGAGRSLVMDIGGGPLPIALAQDRPLARPPALPHGGPALGRRARPAPRRGERRGEVRR